MGDIKDLDNCVGAFLALIYIEKGSERHYIVPFDELRKEHGFIIGRKKGDSGLSISDASISRQHCRLSLNDQDQLSIIDLGSSNGTFVNKVRLVKNELKQLTADDKIQLAEINLNIVFPPKPEVTPQTHSEVQNSPNSESLEAELDPDKTIMGNVSALRSAADLPKNQDQGKHVEHKNAFIEKVMTFGARRSIVSFIITLLLTAISAIGVMDLKMDTGYDSMFSTKDPGYPDYERVVKEFGSDNITLIYYQHNNIFSKERLLALEDTTFALQDLDIVEKTESLFTALSIRDGEDGLDLNPLMDIVPETDEEIATVKDNALYSPLIKRNQLSLDGTKGAIVVTLENSVNDPEYNRRAYEIIEEKIKPLRENFDHVFQVGPPRLNVEIERGMIADMSVITPAATFVLVASIVVMLRTTMAAILPLATAGLSIFWTLGFMGYIGVPVNLLTAILPALVIVIGSTEDTHMLSAYLQGLQEEKTKERFPAIRFMAIHVGLPIFITSFTTTIGFLSNTFSDITLISDFGIATSFAMAANLVATILVLPLLLRLFGPREAKISADYEHSTGLVARFVKFLVWLSEKHQKKIIFVVCLFVLVFAAASLQVTASNDPISYFKSDNQIVKDAQTLHDDLAGMQVFFVTIYAQEGFDFKDPQELKKLEAVQNFMDRQGVYDKTVSILDYIKLVNREMNGSKPEFYAIPETRPMVEQYLLLFQRTDIERFISADAKHANFVVRHNLSDSAILNGYFATLSSEMDSILGNTNPYFLTGKNLMINRAAESLFISQVWSLGLLIIIICILMSILYSSFLAGIVSMIPNIIPVVIMFGTMGFFGIPLNPGTAIVAVIAVGIAIDDTIHLLSTYNKECRIDGDQVAAAIRSVKAEAIPVISTSIALAAGFLVLLSSRFNIVTQFGELSALTMVGAMITDLLITPILLKNVRLVGIWDVISLNLGKEVLVQSEIFAGMSNFQIKRAILLSQVREYEPGTAVIEQGSIGDELYIIVSGEAEVVHFDGKHKKLIAKLGWGEVFGEAGYVGAASRSATVRVPLDGEKLQVIILNQEKVASAMRFYPRLQSKLNQNINKILAQRLLETGKLIQH